MKAAEKVKASGLPPTAVTDKLLRAVLEDGPMEDDEDMQERWANLLANAATSQRGELAIAFPKLLSELEPNEAALLDRLRDKTGPDMFSFTLFGPDDTSDLVGIPELDNLDRLGLLRWVRTMVTYPGSISDENATLAGVKFTELGWAFVNACREPVKAR